MAKFKHLTQEKMDDVCFRLFQVQMGLNGLGSLFEFQSREAVYDPDEFHGIGQLIKQQSKELSILEDILRCGYDSRAITKDL
ncbi:hypothetical protein OAT67_02265 [Bacteriovoracaceae bacterium]|nr:hypothetical protein [Bacteriovoracaceae bacterium]